MLRLDLNQASRARTLEVYVCILRFLKLLLGKLNLRVWNEPKAERWEVDWENFCFADRLEMRLQSWLSYKMKRNYFIILVEFIVVYRVFAALGSKFIWVILHDIKMLIHYIKENFIMPETLNISEKNGTIFKVECLWYQSLFFVNIYKMCIFMVSFRHFNFRLQV